MAGTAARLERLTESVIREMTRVADLHGAINLSQGYPDFDPPQALIEAAAQSVRSGYNQYAVTWGSPRMRSALARKVRHFMGLEIDPDEHITITCGSTEAMMSALLAVCNPGDSVIIFSPYYENYAADTILSSAKPIYVPLHPPDYSFDPHTLRQAFAQGARALVLCNPSNPTGKVFSRQELETIAALSQEFDAFVITDEVYEHIVYAPYQHTYIASLPGMFERTISCSSLSKTYAVTGWRLGYIIAPARISRAVRKVHDFLTVGAPAPLQEAAVVALEFPDSYYHQLQADYTRRRNLFLGLLDQAGLTFSHPQGAYYVLVDISAAGFADDTRFCHWMAEEIGIAAVPGSSFFQEPIQHLIRLNFAKRDETLLQAGERLQRLGDYLKHPG